MWFVMILSDCVSIFMCLNSDPNGSPVLGPNPPKVENPFSDIPGVSVEAHFENKWIGPVRKVVSYAYMYLKIWKIW